MIRISHIAYFTLTAFAATLGTSGLALAQDVQNSDPNQPAVQQPNNTQNQNNNQNHGWRRVDDPAPADTTAAPGPDQNAPDQGPPPAAAPAPAPAPNSQPGYYPGQPAPPQPGYGGYPGGGYPGGGYPSGNYPNGGYPNGGYSNGGYPNGGYPGQSPYPQGPRPNYQQGPPPNYQGAQQPPAPRPPVPASLTIKQGSYITVRVNQVLSSDHNHPGDAFAATLVKPVVVDGVVIAERGQTIGGRVAEAKKAGMVEGTSRLGLQLTDLTLADGQNIPINSQLISRNGPTSVGRDAAAIGGTTALGAAAGAAADWGRGAAIGAGAGAFVGVLGVLLTRGQPTVIYPEQTLTFRLESPITVSTEHAPQAFRYVEPGDYQQADLQRRPPPMMGVAGPAPYYYGSPYYYGPGYYPYYWGPGIGFYYGRGYYRGWRR